MISLFVLSVIALCAASDANFDEKDVLVLTKDNFDSTVNTEDLMLVEFYAPWCGHCKHLAPEYAKAATELLKETPPIKLAKVDATIETELGSRFSISGYPTLKVFRNGKASEFDGPREANGIVKKMRSMSGPSAPLITSNAALDKFAAHLTEVGVVAFVKDGSAEATTFKSLADANREEFRFAIVTDAAITKHAGAEVGSIVVFRPASFETRKESTSAAKQSVNDLKQFVLKNAVPLAGVYDSDNAKTYAQLALPRLVVWSAVDRIKAPKQVDYYINRLRKVAKDFVGKLLFVLADKSSREYTEMNFPATATFGLGVIGADGSKYKAPTSDKFTVEGVQAFANEFISGKAQKYVKSEAEPTSQTDNVVTVVGTSFERIVHDTSKDVFIEFYAPWCGHCKSLAPKYEELATKLKGYESLAIAKIDATANDYPQATYEVGGFPTIYLQKNDGSAPVKYDGAREVKDMTAWLKKNVSRKLKKAKEDL